MSTGILVDERDKYLTEVVLLRDKLSQQEMKLQVIIDNQKARIKVLERESFQKEMLVMDVKEKVINMENALFTLKEEKEKLLMRVQKLKSRKGHSLGAAKMCNNCKKDFKDSENFNWSCRVH